ncbi:hypothetical protein BJF90_37490 [Pseudonocardia sp. CNS-004]|nr:hypothetical protein BJF90_37490 [Pseudonocardia sp. CNS-004]
MLSRVLDLAVVIDFIDTLRDLPPSPAAAAFDQLPADADDATRHALATRLLPRSRTLRVMLPRLQSATTGLSVSAARTLDEAVRDLYNPAQSDVLRRVGLLLCSHPDPVRTPQVGVTSARDRVTAATPRVLPGPQRHDVHSSLITAVPVEHPRKVLEQRPTTRRSVLTATRGAALTGCGVAATPTTSPAPASVTPPSAAPPDDPDLAALEGRSGGRPGVHALDTGSGATVSHRGGERFLMASTATLPLTAAVLDRTTEPALLDRLVRYRPEALLEHAPVTTQNVATGMTVADLYDAAIVGSIRSVILGDALQPAGRGRPAWLVANTTGDATIRAGPAGGWSTTRPGPENRASATTSESSCPGPRAAAPRRLHRPRRPGLDGRQRHHRRGDRIAGRRLVGQ